MKRFKKTLQVLVIFTIILGWFFQYPPTLFLKNFGGRVPPEIQEASLSTILLLTTIFAFAILIVVNPPRAYFIVGAGLYFVVK